MDRQGMGGGLSKSNGTYSNHSIEAALPTQAPTPARPPTPKNILPVQTGVKAQEEEQSSGMAIFFSLLVIAELCLRVTQ
ncbi:hypothetical protein CRUP_029384 [Coryphaenoides rupestris]|nr:hypothetical protein CRUP_029384 [Coryphaenoides rupestris]